jgi:uncharacterized membrane protein
MRAYLTTLAVMAGMLAVAFYFFSEYKISRVRALTLRTRLVIACLILLYLITMKLLLQ